MTKRTVQENGGAIPDQAEDTSRVYATKAQILAIDDLETEDVYVEPWKLWVKVKGISAFERDRYESGLLEQKGKRVSANLSNARTKLIALCIIGDDGQRMFTDREVGILANKSAAALEPIYEAAKRLSGMTEKDVEELEGNSETVLNDDSHSD